jgi:heme exporter protein C
LSLKLVAKFILLVWISLVIYGAYFYAPLAQGLGEYTRVLYFHVPVAWVTVLAFAISALFSLLFLLKKSLKFDYYAEAGNQLGMVFCFLATVTGSIWAKMSWGSFWNWDPRETSIFILLLIYSAYFALRSAIDQEDRRAKLSAVYSLLAFVTVPFFIFIVPRVYASLHPDPLINPQGKMHMNGKMLLVFLTSLAGHTALFFWMLTSKLEIVRFKITLAAREN